MTARRLAEIRGVVSGWRWATRETAEELIAGVERLTGELARVTAERDRACEAERARRVKAVKASGPGVKGRGEGG